MASPKVKLLFGTAAISSWTAEEREEYFKVLKAHDVKDLDTAHIYPNSEQVLSELDASKDFIIHTKAPGFKPGSLTKESVLKAGEQSHKLLKHIETYFLHAPDHDTPIAETLEAVQSLYTHGVFKFLGLSNFSAEEVQEIYDLCESKGYVLPTVYQGNYNAVSRKQESVLFPTLRKLGIKLYAYSPIGGGFLAKPSSSFTGETGHGRFDPNVSFAASIYNKLYNKPKLIEALKKWGTIAEEAGIPPAAMAYRWITYHSAINPKLGDGVIIGASRPEQLEETLSQIEQGPLKEETVKAIDEVWELAKDEAPIDNFYSSGLSKK